MTSTPTRKTPVGENETLSLAPELDGTRLARMLREPGGLARLLESAEPTTGGRGEHALLDGESATERIRVRPGIRGGLLGRLLGTSFRDRYLDGDRVHREFDLWRSLRETGVPIPPASFALAQRTHLGFRTWLGAIDRPNAWDGLALFERASSARQLEAASAASGAALRRLHDAGVLHGDLQLRNLLFETQEAAPETVRCEIIDFDRASQPNALRPADRMAECMRLVRSIEKAGHGSRLTPRLRAGWLRAYCAGDRALRRAMLEAGPRETRRLILHRLGWRLGLPRIALALATLALLGTSLVGCGEDSRTEYGTQDEATPRFSLLAVGDTGRTRPFTRLIEGQLAVSRAMTEEARHNSVSALVLLGDNFYWNGLDRAHLVPRVSQNLVRPYCYFLRLDGPRSGEVEDACDLPESARSPVPVYAVLGNHDIELPESASLQRDTLPDFLPDWRMPRGLAETIELGHGVSLILFESEPRIDHQPEIALALRRAIREAQGPFRILATHRPIATDDYGNPHYGGYPNFVRHAIEAEGLPVQLVLAAHHHNLQVFEVGPPIASLQLGLGSGARAEGPLASKDHPDIRFSRKALGFARIDLVGRGDGARLVATLIEAPRWPLLSPFVDAHPVARFSVDRHGETLELPVGESMREMLVGGAER